MRAGRAGDPEVERARVRGHRARPHTADVTIEAWAPTREECIAEAALALIEGFVDVSGASVRSAHEVRIQTESAEEQLVTVLDEVIYRLETAGEVPIAVEVRNGAELHVTFRTAAVADVLQIGAIPKAVSLHGLTFAKTADQWRCMATIDV